EIKVNVRNLAFFFCICHIVQTFAWILGWEDGDIAFQFKFHFETCTVVCNSFKKGERGKPEETRNAPLRKGNTFNIFMKTLFTLFGILANFSDILTFPSRLSNSSLFSFSFCWMENPLLRCLKLIHL
uniref:Galectin n=1 Tax=Astyanax mexicanus TaxID=7994 RepID=A0A8B9LUE1_ASTMX